MVAAIDQHIADVGGAHLAEGDFDGEGVTTSPANGVPQFRFGLSEGCYPGVIPNVFTSLLFWEISSKSLIYLVSAEGLEPSTP
jgi:hypothetical protein